VRDRLLPHRRLRLAYSQYSQLTWRGAGATAREKAPLRSLGHRRALYLSVSASTSTAYDESGQ
jgi:hypothetical protein